MSLRTPLTNVGERFVFGRQRYQHLFRRLHRLALLGLNYGAGDPSTNGEYRLLDQLSADWTARSIIFDVGGHRGEWSTAVLRLAPHAQVFIFEPNAQSADRIRATLGRRANVQQLAVGERAGEADLLGPQDVPEMGSLHPRDLTHVGLQAIRADTVGVTTLDTFCSDNNIGHVHLIKLDVEGHELAALRGASALLARGAITAVQFEFGGTDIDARVFLRDFLRLLAGYRVFRILRDGLEPVGGYDERDEIFTLSNFVAIRDGA